MKTSPALLILLSSLTFSHAEPTSSTVPQITPESVFKPIAYYEPITTLPPLESDYVPSEQHLELRQAVGAGAVAPVAPVVAGAGAGAVAPAAPAVGVGGAGGVAPGAQPGMT